jgi:NAD(P)-dependent dehydrogenase (short-subunit alcohol dehydrogenase family)
LFTELERTFRTNIFGYFYMTQAAMPHLPNEVASCFLFLACEDSSYITGAFLHPNGGEPTES